MVLESKFKPCAMIFQEAVCSHEYQKNCFIEYNKVAKEYDVERCHQGMQRDCDLPGETVCTIEAEVGKRLLEYEVTNSNKNIPILHHH